MTDTNKNTFNYFPKYRNCLFNFGQIDPSYSEKNFLHDLFGFQHQILMRIILKLLLGIALIELLILFKYPETISN
jgi:hypothetical protein